MTALEHDLTADVLAGLLREQHPDLAHLPISFAARGWGHQMWRLGDELALRLPWAAPDDEPLLKEHRLLPRLPPLPLPVPVPQRLGLPSSRFPRHWAVTTWVPGTPADQAPATRAERAADDLAAFLKALHRPAPDDVPACSDSRGRPLSEVDAGMRYQLKEAVSQGLVPDPEAAYEVWADALAAPVWDGPKVWLHADLHPANVLTDDGTFCGVIDFDALGSGDPACDLGAAWLLLPDGALDRFHRSFPDPVTGRRARGWALWRAVACARIAVRGGPGGKPSWLPAAARALRRLTSEKKAPAFR